MTTPEHALRTAADLFIEIVSAFSAEDLLKDNRNAIVQDKLRDNLRSHDQLRRIATDGFELCVRALAEMGASGVSIHECGEQALGAWGDDGGR